MSNYVITVNRGSKDGKLKYTGTGVMVETKCWWDPERKIPKGTYKGCSATTMTTKKNSKGQPREAIFIPNVKGYKGIFIHRGSGPSWSDGCIVALEHQVQKIYNNIPKINGNITVIINDI